MVFLSASLPERPWWLIVQTQSALLYAAIRPPPQFPFLYGRMQVNQEGHYVYWVLDALCSAFTVIVYWEWLLWRREHGWRWFVWQNCGLGDLDSWSCERHLVDERSQVWGGALSRG